MASASDIAEVRVNSNLAAGDATWTDEVLAALIDASGVAGATYKVWLAKAASYVEESESVTEAGASHKFALHKNALEMVKLWGKAAGETGEGGEPVITGPVVSDIVRST